MIIFQIFAWYNKLGLCMGTKGTSGLLDRLRQQYTVTTYRWKERNEVL